MTFTIGGFTEAELDRQKAAQPDPTKGAIETLKIVSERLGMTVAVDGAEYQSISRQQSFGVGARPQYGSTPPDETRRARLQEFRNSDAAKIPSMLVDERAAAVAEAKCRVAELRGGVAQPGDAAEEMRNDRLLGQVRTRLGENAGIAAALVELERHTGNRNQLGLVADELRARYPEPALLISHGGRKYTG